MKPETIAGYLGRNPKTVYTQLQRGREILKQKLIPVLPFPKVRYECMNDLNKLNEKLFDVMLEEATQNTPRISLKKILIFLKKNWKL